MEPVQSSLKKWMRENEDFQQNYLKIKREVRQDPEIKEFISHHPQLTQKEIDKNLIKLYEYKTQSKQCDKCTSLGRRSEERRVGKECRSRWATYDKKKKKGLELAEVLK